MESTYLILHIKTVSWVTIFSHYDVLFLINAKFDC